MMDKEDFVNNIKKGNWNQLKADLKVRIAELNAKQQFSDLKELTQLVIIRVVSCINKTKLKSQEEIDSLFVIVSFCHDQNLKARAAVSNQQNQDLQLAKSLYHVFNYFINQGPEKYETIVKLNDIVNEELVLCCKASLSESDKSVLTALLLNCRLLLWNAAIEIEKNPVDSQFFFRALTLRQNALSYLSMTPGCYLKYCQQAYRAVLESYNHCGDVRCLSLETFYKETFKHICQKFLSTEQDLPCLEALSSFVEVWTKYLLTRNTLTRQEALTQIKNIRTFCGLHKKLKPGIESAWGFYMDIIQVAFIFHPFDGNNFNLSDTQIDSLILKCKSFLKTNTDSIWNEFIHKSLLPLSRSILVCCKSENLQRRLENKFYLLFVYLKRLLSAFVKRDSCNSAKSDRNPVYIMCFKELLTLCAMVMNCELEKSEGISPDIGTNLGHISNFIQIYGCAVTTIQKDSKKEIATFVERALKVAVTFYMKKYYKEFNSIMDLCAEHFIEIMTDDCKDIVNELSFNISNKLRVYISSLCKCQRFSDAQHFLARLVAAGYNDLNESLELWASVKRLGSETDDCDIRRTTIVDLVLKYADGASKIDVQHLLNLEIEVYKARSSHYCYNANVEMYAALEKLVAISTDDVDKASSLIKMTKCLLATPKCSTSTPADLCQKATQLLLKHKKRKRGKNLSVEDCYLAKAYFCQHIIDVNASQDLSTQKVESSLKDLKVQKATEMNDPNYDNSDDRNRDDLIPSYEHITLGIDLDVAKNLDSIVSIWSSVILFNMNIIPSMSDCLEDLIAIAENYSMMRLITYELKVWMLARQVAQITSSWLKFCYASCRIICILNQCGMTDRGEFLSEVKSRLLELDSEDIDVNLMKVYAMVCESELLLMENKIIDGWQTLKIVLKQLTIIPKSTLRSLIESEAKLLESKYYELPTTLLPLSEREKSTPFELTYKAIQIATILLSCNLELRHIHLKPRVVNCLFNSTLHLGKLYLGIGAPREARCYFKEQLIWAHKLNLANRTAEVLLLLAKVDVLSGDSKCCQVKLNAVNYILNSAGIKLTTSLTSKESTDSNSPLNTNDELLLSTCNLNDSLNSDSSVNSLHASPILNNVNDSLKHPLNCNCMKCQHILFHRLCLEFSCLQAQCFFLQQGRERAAINLLKKKLGEFSRQYLIEKSLISEISNLCSGDVTPSSELVLKGYLSLLFVKNEIVCTLAVMCLKEGCIDEARQIIKNAYKEANKLPSIGLQQTHVAISYLKYLYCAIKIIEWAKKENIKPSSLFDRAWPLARIPASSDNIDLDIAFIDECTSRIKLNDDLVDCYKTPKSSKVTGRPKTNCRAPARKNILSVHANNFDEVIEIDTEIEKKCEPQKEYHDNDENSSSDKKSTKNRSAAVAPRRSQRRVLGPTKESNNNTSFNSQIELGKTNRHKIKLCEVNKVSKNKSEKEQPMKSVGFNSAKFIALLESALSSISHHPVYPLYSDLHVLLALCKGRQQNDQAYHLLESVGVTLRYQGLLTATSQINFCKQDSSPNETLNFNEMRLENLAFNKSELNCDKRMNEFCKSLPKDCVICQINTAPRLFREHGRRSNPELLITRLQNGCEPIVIKVCNNDTDVVNDFLSEFQKIINDYNLGNRLTDKNEWWKARYDINDRIKVILSSVEDVWLSYWKGLLLGSPAHESDRKKLNDVVEQIITKFSDCGFTDINRHVLELVVDSVPWLNQNQLRQAVEVIIDVAVDECRIGELCKCIQHLTKQLCSKTLTRKLVVLVLDKETHCLPWENIPMLCGQVLTRMPSIHYILSHLTVNRTPKKVNTSNSFYVLNPEGNLTLTQSRFETFFESLKWPGLTQKRPTKEEWSTALSTKDLFVYCGHGSGVQFISGRSVQNLRCKASVVLSGCGSAKLYNVNSFEPCGVVYNYLVAGCPSIFGTLWNVTDGEIDQVVLAMLKKFLTSQSKQTLAEVVSSSRTACKLHYVTGASTVIYGMPVVAD